MIGLKRQKRDRHTLESDRKNNFGELARKDPGEKARERMRRPAYAPVELSFQARRPDPAPRAVRWSTRR